MNYHCSRLITWVNERKFWRIDSLTGGFRYILLSPAFYCGCKSTVHSLFYFFNSVNHYRFTSIDANKITRRWKYGLGRSLGRTCQSLYGKSIVAHLTTQRILPLWKTASGFQDRNSLQVDVTKRMHIYFAAFLRTVFCQNIPYCKIRTSVLNWTLNNVFKLIV